MDDKIVVAYIPVVHQGYLNYLASTGAKKVYALQAKDLPDFPYLARETRTLGIQELSQALGSLGYEVFEFSELEGKKIPEGTQVYIPEDDVTRKLNIEGNIIWGNAFLRWDWTKSTVKAFVQPEADRAILKSDPMHEVCTARMQMLLSEARKSSDWWRQVASLVITSSGQCLVSYNKHYPHEYAPYMDGDPRSSFNPGEFIEISTALHGERAVIAEAARKGLALEGSELYVTTFPCNDCANWIVVAGIKKVFFLGGYSNLNGQKTLRDNGVELLYVEI